MNGMTDERYEKLMSLTFERDDWRRRAEAAERQLREIRHELDEIRRQSPDSQLAQA